MISALVLCGLILAFLNWRQATRLREGLRYRQVSLDDLAAKNVPEGLAAAKRAAALMPDDADAVGLEGLLENQSGHPAAALAALRRANALRPNDRDYLLPMVQLEMESEDLPAAERTLAPWLGSHPKDAWACHLMAVIYERKPHTPDVLQTARNYEERARAGLPDDLRVYMALGQLDLAAGRNREALSTYQTGLRLEPQSVIMLHGLLTCWERLGETQQAAVTAAKLQTLTALLQRIQHLQDTLNLNPSDTGAALELGQLEEQDNNPGGAQGYYLRTLRRAPRDPRVRAAVVAFYRRQNEPKMAQQAARPDFVP